MQNNKQRFFRLVQCLTVMTPKVMIMMMTNLMETLLRLLLIVKMKTMMMEDQGKSFLSLCLWLYNRDQSQMLVTESLCWRLFLFCWCFFNRRSAFSNFLVRGRLRSAFSEIPRGPLFRSVDPWSVVQDEVMKSIYRLWAIIWSVKYIIYKTKIVGVEKSSNPNWILKVIRWNSRGTFLSYFSYSFFPTS